MPTLFWIYNPYVLVSPEFNITFGRDMTLEEKYNAVTRIFLIVIIIMALLRVQNLYIYFFGGLMTIIALYLICRTTIAENFVQPACFAEMDINNLSNSLHVPPPIRNNRFNEPPPIINPSHDINDWRQSTLVEHSAVNRSRNGFRIRGSGYIPDEDAEFVYPTPHNVGSRTREKLPYRRQVIPNLHPPCTVPVPEPCSSNSSIPVYSAARGGLPTAGDLIEHCGYNPEKGRVAGVPHNAPVSINDYDPSLTQYHRDMNMQTIDPGDGTGRGGVYTTTEVHEPQVDNMGISFQQQFQPVAVDVDDRGNIIYARKDPRTYTPVEYAYDYGEITPDSIYDPRLTGYGDHRRTYLDTVAGQPRFYYDDVNASREMNYITRNKIDVYNFGNQTGIFDKEVDCNPLSNVRIQAQDAFITHGNEHRANMQQSLMRKANERTRQQRLAPIRRDAHTRMMK